jgi:hypothetical protein
MVISSSNKKKNAQQKRHARQQYERKRKAATVAVAKSTPPSKDTKSILQLNDENQQNNDDIVSSPPVVTTTPTPASETEPPKRVRKSLRDTRSAVEHTEARAVIERNKRAYERESLRMALRNKINNQSNARMGAQRANRSAIVKQQQQQQQLDQDGRGEEDDDDDEGNDINNVTRGISGMYNQFGAHDTTEAQDRNARKETQQQRKREKRKQRKMQKRIAKGDTSVLQDIFRQQFAMNGLSDEDGGMTPEVSEMLQRAMKTRDMGELTEYVNTKAEQEQEQEKGEQENTREQNERDIVGNREMDKDIESEENIKSDDGDDIITALYNKTLEKIEAEKSSQSSTNNNSAIENILKQDAILSDYSNVAAATTPTPTATCCDTKLFNGSSGAGSSNIGNEPVSDPETECIY